MTQQGILNPIALESIGTASVGRPEKGKDPAKHPNAMMLAYLCLIEAENICTKTSMLKAKELANNASMQEKLNKESSQLHWAQIPSDKANHHEKTVTYWTFSTTWLSFQDHKKQVHWTTYPNQDAIAQAEVKNQLQMAVLQENSNQLNVLEQSAKVGMTDASVEANKGIQALSEASNIMQIVESLTFQALLRHEPQS